MTEGTKQVTLLIVGGLLLLLNKPLAASYRAFYNEFSDEKYREDGLLGFRLPVILIGSLLLFIGISFFFS